MKEEAFSSPQGRRAPSAARRGAGRGGRATAAALIGGGLLAAGSTALHGEATATTATPVLEQDSVVVPTRGEAESLRIARVNAMLTEAIGDPMPVAPSGPPPEALVTVMLDDNIVYEDSVIPELGADGLYHYRGGVGEGNVDLWWDIDQIRRQGVSDVLVTGRAGCTNLDDEVHSFVIETTFDVPHLHLPAHVGIDAPTLGVVTVLATDENGGSTGTLAGRPWGTDLKFSGESQWGNHYFPWFMSFGGIGIIVYTEAWHDVFDRDPLTTTVSLTQGYELSAGEQLDFTIVHRVRLKKQ
jgi:hypothetical protein